MRWLSPVTLLCVLLMGAAPQPKSELSRTICLPCIRGDMSFLASDTLAGRGSGTRDEHLTALYAASLFTGFGLQPGAGNGGFVQEAPLPSPLPPPIAKHVAGFTPGPGTSTWNVVAILPGASPVLGKEAILLTAHLDHLGVGPAKNGDSIYNGADDDASGTTAVIELARAFAAGRRPQRTIIFALFGSEELGGFGNQYFLEHPPVPLNRIVANLEFEMIGRRDPALAEDTLWLTGYERSTLGPELAKHGALLSADPHPAEKFFQRSDNYGLAKRGIVAHTVSSFGLHTDYHQPGDELGTIDFAHMDKAIRSMVEPIAWLARTPWKPEWLPNGRP